LPVRPSVPIPPFAVDGQNICERVEAAPSNPQTNPAGSSYDINSDSSCGFPLPGGGSVLTGR
ncbi:MAG TPA: hypothetical protein VLG27_04635, partial [Candidatus Saccharimonadia bacterium]|nr:hypothetical protein [Candidatus Saccharimonadia bacterium]